MAFLDDLGSALKSTLNDMAGVTENTPGGIDSNIGPLVIPYGKLGEFAQKIDRTANRSYIESGFINNSRPRNLEILMQEPDITVLVKKRHFSSLSENYRTDLMNEEEKLFLRAAKRLFYNKCRAIATYERLCKVEKLAVNNGVVSDYMFPIITSLVDTGTSLFPGLFENSSILSTLETIKKVKAFSDPNYVTTWINDRTVPYSSDTGEGTGVIELTIVSSVNTVASVDFAGGSARLSIEDPYKLMIITENDIEKAIAEASSVFSTNNFFKLSQENLEDQIVQLKNQLRQARFNRGASDIRFSVNPDVKFNKKVRAFIDQEGREIIFNFDAGLVGIGSSVEFDESAFEGTNGLRGNEISLLEQILKNIYIAMGIQEQSNIELISFNKQTNNVRSRMIMEFNGKPIVQPMDELRIFQSSKTLVDDKVGQGISINFTDGNLLSKINSTLSSIEQSFDQLKSMFDGPGAGSYTEIEKNAIAGPEFPLWLWVLMRNQFLRQSAGTCIFAGVVESSPHSNSGGKYELSVSAKDNCYYFQLSKVNVQPSVDVFNGAIYDPITPFDLTFDSASGFQNGETPTLLEENIRLLSTGAIKAQTGRFRGSAVDEKVYKTIDVEVLGDGFTRRKFTDPLGLVYRWKRGIGSLTNFGPPHSKIFQEEASVSLTKNPFAGQDVMNVLALLVTGQPYNFNTFIKSAVDHGKITRDNLTNEGSGQSFFRGLLNELRKVNATWGNFIPFKKLVVNESSYNFLRSGQFDITVSNTKLSDLTVKRAQKFDLLIAAMPEVANNPTFYNSANGKPINVDINVLTRAEVETLVREIVDIDLQIQKEASFFSGLIQNPNIKTKDGALRIFGDDVSFDSTVAQNSDISPEQQKANREQLRQRINILTQRRLWKVKSNEDPNLFIVDDTYDKNYDIQAFEQRLSDQLSLFNSQRLTPAEQIHAVSKLLGLEVFADSQGHINARPPQYNKVPSSVFVKMLQKKQKKGIQIFPNFLETLFFNQMQGLAENIEILEDEIRLRAAAIGAASDRDAAGLLGGSIATAGALAITDFTFVTEEITGSLMGSNISDIITSSFPDLMEDRSKETLEPFTQALDTLTTKLTRPLSQTANNFDIVKRIDIVNKSETFNKSSSASDRFNTIYNRLLMKKGSAPTLIELNPKFNAFASGYSQVDLLKITEEIAQLIRDRQPALRLLANAIKNLNDGVKANAVPNEQGGFDAIGEALENFGEDGSGSGIPEILKHMIEDESFDDYGSGSGRRYIIKDSQIISLTIQENPPPFTVVEVKGSITSSLTADPSGEGGDTIAKSWSVDYDMWRMYGFRTEETVEIPYFTDPVTQCAPYGVFLLNQARKRIFTGSVTIVGNEFIQPGEVYYLEDRDLLFYAQSVSHSFSYGQNFTTTIELTYGHSPGEYIPTTLDIIGKGLYSKNHRAGLVKHEREQSANGDLPVSTLVVDNPNEIFNSNALESLLKGANGDRNRKALGNLLAACAGVLAPRTVGEQPKIEIRIYKNSSKNLESYSLLEDVAAGILEWAKNPGQFAIGGDMFSSSTDEPPVIDPTLLSEPVIVDIGDPNETRTPSSQAWSIARSLAKVSNPINIPNANVDPTVLANNEMVYLITKVIDIWLVYTPVEETFSGGKVSDQTVSQSDIETRNQILSNFLASINTGNS